MEMEIRRTKRRKEEKKRSTADDLSDHLIAKILDLLPLNTIIQCRDVCKRWQYLIDSFLTSPLNIADSGSCNLHNYNCMKRGQSGGVQISELDLCIDFPKKGPYKHRILTSCNGLFFSFYFDELKTSLHGECYISNPWTKEYVRIPNPRGVRRIFSGHDSLCGLAVENHSRDNNNVASYKVVMAHRNNFVPKNEEPYFHDYKFEVYSPDIKRWLLLRTAREPHRCRGTLDQNAVYCNRALYWQCSEKDHALFFSLETQASGYLNLPREEGWEEEDHEADAITFKCRLIECDGHLHYIRVRYAGTHRLIVWKMSTASGQWLILHNVDLAGAMDLDLDFFRKRRQNRFFPVLTPIDMSCRGYDKVFFMDHPGTNRIPSYKFRRIVSYNLKSGVFEFELFLRGFCTLWWKFFRYTPTTKRIC